MDPIYELIFYSCILLILVIVYNWAYGEEPKTLNIDKSTITNIKV